MSKYRDSTPLLGDQVANGACASSRGALRAASAAPPVSPEGLSAIRDAQGRSARRPGTMRATGPREDQLVGDDVPGPHVRKVSAQPVPEFAYAERAHDGPFRGYIQHSDYSHTVEADVTGHGVQAPSPARVSVRRVRAASSRVRPAARRLRERSGFGPHPAPRPAASPRSGSARQVEHRLLGGGHQGRAELGVDALDIEAAGVLIVRAIALCNRAADTPIRMALAGPKPAVATPAAAVASGAGIHPVPV